MEKVVKLTPDYLDCFDTITKKIISDKLKGGPVRTKIIIRDGDTGEVLGERENKVVISGSIFQAINAFGVESPVTLPNYNDELQLDNTLDYTSDKRLNQPFVCLFCVGDSGCGTTQKDVYKVNFTDRIDPVDDIIPFRYQDINDDLNEDLRKYYFGRKTIDNKIAYYFKTFDTAPQLHLRYTDGTQITNEMYSVQSDQAAECYIETRLRVNRVDCRDYFEQVLGWDKARISTLSLCHAWYDDTIDQYKWYQEIQPYTKLNYSVEWLQDLSRSVEFQYQLYF